MLRRSRCDEKRPRELVHDDSPRIHGRGGAAHRVFKEPHDFAKPKVLGPVGRRLCGFRVVELRDEAAPVRLLGLGAHEEDPFLVGGRYELSDVRVGPDLRLCGEELLDERRDLGRLLLVYLDLFERAGRRRIERVDHGERLEDLWLEVGQQQRLPARHRRRDTGALGDDEADRLLDLFRAFVSKRPDEPHESRARFGGIGLDPRQRRRIPKFHDREVLFAGELDAREPRLGEQPIRQCPQILIGDRGAQSQRELTLQLGSVVLDVELEALRHEIDEPRQVDLLRELGRRRVLGEGPPGCNCIKEKPRGYGDDPAEEESPRSSRNRRRRHRRATEPTAAPSRCSKPR